MSPKMSENILDILSTNPSKKNGFIDHGQQQQQQQRVLPIPPSTISSSKPLVTPSNSHIHHNNVAFDGLEDNIKFFMNFHKNLKDMNGTTTGPPLGHQPEYPNGFNNGIHHNNSFYSSFTSPTDRLAMMKHKQMEEQFLNLGLKQSE